ncbi:DNA cytosine methyltransferase [Leuconostoc mesenteroides]|uniref:DNA cytosine methyltransferase n=1 Tax=Leuconostoc mesenteroides TaxID=1245 RepID=UPI001CBCE390|nr:DNA cytosine methyltransferase [Leuconostoc mesenteroides]MBZ1513123.1 DNA cytosine methyltransferase [Leuconostoc mesenteroides]MBZ1530110.1 DNA cytosine methyltransferase [Leuconostoc mesenteroides]
MGKKIKALDLFAGAGGFSYGMERAGIDVVAAVEIDSKIAATYEENHPQTFMINSDVRKIAANHSDSGFENTIVISDLFAGNSVDIIFGGPPCQGFSMAGRRIRKDKPFFEDERNRLFLEFHRMVKNLNPKVFIIENVPGILNYDNGRVKQEIYEKFKSIGYDVSSRILSADRFGVPQKRKRAIFIGNRVGISSSELFPKETYDKQNAVTVWDAIGDLPSLNSGEGTEITKYNQSAKTQYQRQMRNTVNDYFFNHVSSTHSEKTLKIMSLIKPGQTLKDLPKQFQTKSVHSGAYGRMKKYEPSYTLTTRINTPSVGRITHPIDNRTITPREAARIQSFPDSYHFLGDITTVGMQIGNSVPPLLAQAIGKSIVKKVFK